ncbi:glycerophosphodiester phosphodiesterase [Thermofilum pendens]|uniref:Glycerophosphoryl diester phosphodiesterase n=1 Tax=Thermofilum pendens (strain DSM 2475 / Hrk 5) TaxID=368408 RepID=A1RZD5_THEPD|nr:glycerophosphodiester phosphodiesterase [Thermofilum pendens]ABL78565.1 glycerophosphoryl diester phosphodiesterase [Thermofilum pendens Hrk 5]
MPGKNFSLTGHRGAAALEPENTLPSFLKAYECGATGIEFDVRLTRDGVVVAHDDELERVAGVKGRVSEKTYSELLGVRVGGRARIPTLREVLSLAKGRLSVDIELKVVGAEAEVVDSLRELRMVDDALVTSFVPEALRRVKELAPEVSVGVLLEEWDDEYLEIAEKLGAEALLPYYEALSRDLVERIKKRGFKVITWTVDDPEVAERLYRLGIDGVITDDPCLLARRLRFTGG